MAGHGCVDLTPEITASNIFALVQPGTLVPTGPAKFSIGGAVPNTGAALARLGNRNVYLRCPAARDAFGNVLRNLLLSLGFSDATMDLYFDDEASAGEMLCTSFSIIISPKGQDRFILHCPGVNPRLRAAGILSVPLAQHDWLHVGYPPLLHGLTANEGSELSYVFSTARQMGLTTSLDMCTPDTTAHVPWRNIFSRVLPFVHCFTPSYEEIALCLGVVGPPSLVKLRDMADELIACGAHIVLIKMSSAGLYLRTSPAVASEGLGRGAELGLVASEREEFLRAWTNAELISPSFAVNCVGTLGAGDCTIAAFLTCLSLHSSAGPWLGPSEALQIANAVGACNVEAEDALSGLSSIEATRKRVSEGWDRNELPALGLDQSLIRTIDSYGNLALHMHKK